MKINAVVTPILSGVRIARILIFNLNCSLEKKDRWGNTPLDDCIRENHPDISSYLEEKNNSMVNNIYKMNE